ncbi:man1-Src1p-carboxy-terminal domain protein [Wolffia australiana]
MASAKRKNVHSKGRQRTTLFKEPPAGLFPSGEEILRLFIVISLASSVALACHLLFSFKHRQQIPFCDSGDEALDFCEPCPDHAECSRGRWECLLGYKKKGWICVEDGEITRQLETLSKMMEEHICGEYAQFLCRGSGKAWFSESDVLNFLENRIKPVSQVDNSYWDILSQNTIKAVANSLEIRMSALGDKELKCADNLVELYKPYSCVIEDWAYRNIWLLVSISFLIPASAILAYRLHRKRCISNRAEELYDQVCEILRESALSAKSKDTEADPWVGCSWLRDHLLLPKERRDKVLWRKVEELIREDSRIDEYPRMIKGEQKVVLQWQVEGYLSSEIMRTKAKTATRRTKVLEEAK